MLRINVEISNLTVVHLCSVWPWQLQLQGFRLGTTHYPCSGAVFTGRVHGPCSRAV